MRNGHALLLLFLTLLGCAIAPRDTAADREQLLALHRKALRAHLEQNVDLLLEDESDDYVVANRGNVSTPAKAQRAGVLGPYLRSTKFDSYADTVDPIVRVSADGTMGWVICRITARGISGGEPLEFTSAWIELYEKRGGRWLRVGNVSNFKS